MSDEVEDKFNWFVDVIVEFEIGFVKLLELVELN